MNTNTIDFTNLDNTVSPRPIAINIYKQYPDLRDRVTRGVELYKAGKVNLQGAFDMIAVGSSDGRRSYLVAPDLSTCSCPDHTGRNGTHCKHIIAAGLALASFELAQRKLPTLVKRLRTVSRAA